MAPKKSQACWGGGSGCVKARATTRDTAGDNNNEKCPRWLKTTSWPCRALLSGGRTMASAVDQMDNSDGGGGGRPARKLL